MKCKTSIHNVCGKNARSIDRIPWQHAEGFHDDSSLVTMVVRVWQQELITESTPHTLF